MVGLFEFSDRLTVLPVVHGSGDVAVAVRHHLLSRPFDCLAVPLPTSFAMTVTAGVEALPAISIATQLTSNPAVATYVPIEPCQPVVAGIRWALAERVPIAWIDREVQDYEPLHASLPDPYALKQLSLEAFSTAIVPFLPRPGVGSQQDARVCRQAFELHRLELDHERIVALVHLADWPWVREAYLHRRDYPEHENYFEPIHHRAVRDATLLFFLGELPFITALYERSRASLDADDNLSIDGVKQLLLEARDRAQVGRSTTSPDLTPHAMQLYLRYVRNVTLLERRLSPDLYTLVMAAKQFAGDRFARHLLETARDYPVEYPPLPMDEVKMGIGQADLPDAGVVQMLSRLPGMAVHWRTCQLIPEPPRKEKQRWRTAWNPFQQCSWPPEDERVESFHSHVRQQARLLIGADLARVEKFTTSVKDGVDIRETLRHWHQGDIYVREYPPARGGLDTVVFLFDVPADPDKYPWQTTWMAEHQEESTLGFFATDFRQDMVGPGIGRAQYGGVFFLFPPRLIPDIWSDPRLLQDGPLEDRLLVAALFHSQETHVAIVSPVPLKASWRQLARRLGKRLVHLPLSRFSARTIDKVRTVHVLNGKEIRSYAAKFIFEE